MCSTTFLVMSARSFHDLRANNLQPKEKRLSIVFSTVDTTKQGVGRAECTEAKGDDYAARAVVHEVQIPSPQPKKFSYPFGYLNFFFLGCGGGSLLQKLKVLLQVYIHFNKKITMQAKRENISAFPIHSLFCFYMVFIWFLYG